MAMKTIKGETPAQFLRRFERCMHKAPKNGGPTQAQILKAIDLKRKSAA